MKALLSLSVFLLASVALFAQQGPQLSEQAQANIQSRIDGGVNPSIMVGLVDKNGTSFYSFGKISVNDDQAPDENTLYEIGSISKVFTSILMADMATKKELTIEDPIEKFLPKKVTAPTRNDASIQLHHLATHTSALPRLPDNMNPKDPGNPYADYTVKQMYSFLSKHTLRRDIGSEYEYSNLAVGLLGHLLALRAEDSYEDLMKGRICSDIGMDATVIAIPDDLKDRLAPGHSSGVEVSNWDIPTLAGAGAIRSTASDMVKFLAANMGLHKSDLYAAMQMTHAARLEGAAGGMDVGLGWHIRPGTKKTIWHNGGTGGYRAFAGFTDDGAMGVVVLTNSTAGVDDIGFHILDPSFPLSEVKPEIAAVLHKTVEKDGIDAAIEQYQKLKTENPSGYNFQENQLNTLGYQYLGKGEKEMAVKVFRVECRRISEFIQCL